MKHVLALLAMVATLLNVAAVDKIPAGNRVVFKTAREFNEIVVNGNVVVECKFHPDHSGYLVYYTDNNSAPRIKAVNYEDKLIINADSATNAITSRLTVLCHDTLKSVVTNDGIILTKKFPQCDDMTLVANGCGAIYAGDIKCANLAVVNNGNATIGIRKVKAAETSMVNNGLGKITVGDLKTVRLSVTNNSSGSVTANGRAKIAAMNVNSSGDIYAMGLKCIDLTAQVQGDGSIGCDVKNRAVINILGSGSVMGRRLPKEIEGNVDNCFKIAPNVK